MSVTRLRARADRVNRECDLGELLQEYGYAVVPDPEREQQFSCDLHGPDLKPSARLYGANNSTYCWVCQKKRDPIAYVMEKENAKFVEAIEMLERRLGLAPLPWEDEGDRPRDVADELDEIAAMRVTYADERERTHRLLTAETQERSLNAATLLSFWEAFDRVDYGVARQDWGESRGIVGLKKLRERLFERLREAS